MKKKKRRQKKDDKNKKSIKLKYRSQSFDGDDE